MGAETTDLLREYLRVFALRSGFDLLGRRIWLHCVPCEYCDFDTTTRVLTYLHLALDALLVLCAVLALDLLIPLYGLDEF